MFASSNMATSRLFSTGLPPGLNLIFNYQSPRNSVVHSLYDNWDEDPRVKDPSTRDGIERFDRILVVGKSRYQFRTGLVAKKRDNTLIIHWDDCMEYKLRNCSRIVASKCAVIPYTREEGLGRIGVYVEPQMFDLSNTAQTTQRRARRT